MRYERICAIFRWLSTKWPIALFAILVLLLIALTSCTTTKKLSTQTNSQRQQTLTQSNERSVVDRSVVYDTIYEVVVETIWCPPDTLGKVYPQVTKRTEYGASRQTQNDVVTQTHDTIYIHDAVKTSENTSSDIRAPSTMSVVIPWLIILGMIVLAVAIIAIRLMIKG